jgi:hypothetical protein
MVLAPTVTTLVPAMRARSVKVSFINILNCFFLLIALDITKTSEEEALKKDYEGYPGFKMPMGQQMSQQELREQLQLVEDEIASRKEKESRGSPARRPGRSKRQRR